MRLFRHVNQYASMKPQHLLLRILETYRDIKRDLMLQVSLKGCIGSDQ